jgi:protein tyrosine/serine phosphatase
MSDPSATSSIITPKSNRARTLAIAIVLLVGVILAALLVWRNSHTYHLATVQEGVLYRDGLKSRAQFEATLDHVHPKTVVSLIDENELADPHKPQLAAEAELCSAHGVTLDRIPVKLGGWPTSDDIHKFIAIVTDKPNQPVLVHCAQGVRRTGLFVAAYEESVLGWDKEKTKAAVLSFGHRMDTVNDIKRFIDGYDPKTETVPGDLGRGSE